MGSYYWQEPGVVRRTPFELATHSLEYVFWSQPQTGSHTPVQKDLAGGIPKHSELSISTGFSFWRRAQDTTIQFIYKVKINMIFRCFVLLLNLFVAVGLRQLSGTGKVSSSQHELDSASSLRGTQVIPAASVPVPSGSSICGTVTENGNIFFQIPVGQTFSDVVFASYGTPLGVCDAYVVGACNAVSSIPVVTSLCVGNNKCTVYATNSVFGDPCVGTSKRLFVQLQIAGGPLTITPSTMPTSEPTNTPTKIPTAVPTSKPSKTPTVVPTSNPTKIPTAIPTDIPTAFYPNRDPNGITHGYPNGITHGYPNSITHSYPNGITHGYPNSITHSYPNGITHSYPNTIPTALPTAIPTALPTAIPTALPTAIPTALPTAIPTALPTAIPTALPTAIPTALPTAFPTGVPTALPTGVPTALPTGIPTNTPTALPTALPTELPTHIPTAKPTRKPITVGNRPSPAPVVAPTDSPTTGLPTGYPTAQPIPPSPVPVSTSTPTDVSFPSPSPSAAPSLTPVAVPVCETSKPTINPGDFICGLGQAENEIMTLVAPPRTVLGNVSFASYGDPTGYCGSFSKGSCDSSNTISVMNGLCAGKTACVVPVTNAEFSDPCLGVDKRLYVQIPLIKT
eukprot:gene9246-19197_t